MSGPQQWTPNGLVPAVSSSGQALSRPPEEDEEDDALPPPRPQRAAKPLAPRNVIALAKARLREVKKELRVKARLEKERDELERLLAAAQKPRAVVREIKRTAG